MKKHKKEINENEELCKPVELVIDKIHENTQDQNKKTKKKKQILQIE
jgi:hypothetical protein